ncbi:hypothetical protein GA0070617_0852 [Micromonospora yangpuensis]|uniref:Uncharacterized protein n=1 Tax=Micromonospora yangpuensis TaxID=683228 RepID=A0A1C6U2W4_9ACTN|nr:hypothetical protein GA0070617_0852 [Micromonospora yangpuensis]
MAAPPAPARAGAIRRNGGRRAAAGLGKDTSAGNRGEPREELVLPFGLAMIDEVSAHQRGAAPEVARSRADLASRPAAGGINPQRDAVVASEEFRTLKPAFVSCGEHLPIPQRSDTTSQTSDSPGQRPVRRSCRWWRTSPSASAPESHSRRINTPPGPLSDPWEIRQTRLAAATAGFPAPGWGPVAAVRSGGFVAHARGPDQMVGPASREPAGWSAVRRLPASPAPQDAERCRRGRPGCAAVARPPRRGLPAPGVRSPR